MNSSNMNYEQSISVHGIELLVLGRLVVRRGAFRCEISISTRRPLPFVVADCFSFNYCYTMRTWTIRLGLQLQGRGFAGCRLCLDIVR